MNVKIGFWPTLNNLLINLKINGGDMQEIYHLIWPN